MPVLTDVAQLDVGQTELFETCQVAPQRIVLYSHDTMGLGHMRRNLLIAQTLCDAFPRASVLLIAGAQELGAFAMPPRVDCLTLPGLRKQDDGLYRSRHLGLSLHDLLSLRAEIICAAVEAFEPDALIVDNVPRGAEGELDPALKQLRAGGHTSCILGLRDVLDEPAALIGQWQRAANEAAIRDYYDAVWIYGDPRVYDPVREYGFSSEVAAKVQFTGYQDRRWRLRHAESDMADMVSTLDHHGQRFMLCLVGGGEDGARLAETFAEAELPDDSLGFIVTGPYMPALGRRRLRELAAARPRLRTIDFVTDPEALIGYADRVVTMGGYNTVTELLSFGKHALIVPRVRPRSEQWIRAQRLQALGLVDVLHPDDLSPAALSLWMAREPRLPADRQAIDLNAASRLPRLLERALAARTLPAPIPAVEVKACELPTY